MSEEESVSCEFDSAQIAQVHALSALGAVVKNTFIDVMTLQPAALQRRARSSSPLRSPASGFDRMSDISGSCISNTCSPSAPISLPRSRTLDEQDEISRASGFPGTPQSSCSPRCQKDRDGDSSPSLSSASTVCSEELQEFNEPSEADYTVAEDLAERIRQECGFLRISETQVHMNRYHLFGRNGTMGTIRFIVDGLPSISRAKWLQPLFWSVKTMLERNGVDVVKLRGGELVCCPDDGPRLSIRFVSARSA